MPSRQVDPRPTYAAETVQARLTQGPVDTSIPDVPLMTSTPIPATPTESGPPTPTNSPIPPTETSVPCDRATFDSDVTIPDGTTLSQSESFTKTWRLKNAGTCTWNADYELLFKDGDSMDGPASQQLTTGSIAPGQTVDISVDLVAPSEDGSYRGYWWLRADSGVVFGIGASGQSPFFVDIKVGEPEPTEAPFDLTAKINLDQTFSVDFDTTTITSGSGADLRFHAVSSTEKYLEPRNGAQFKLLASRPTLATCQSEVLSSSQISLDTVSSGNWLCFKTTDNQIGLAEIEAITAGDPQTITFDYGIWDT